MKTLQQHIEEKLIINKNFVNDNTSDLDEIFKLIEKSEWLSWNECDDNILETIDMMTHKAVKDVYPLSAICKEFVDNYKKEKLPLDGLKTYPNETWGHHFAPNVLIYDDSCHYIHDKRMDLKIHTCIKNCSNINFYLYEEKYECNIYSDNKYLFIEIWDRLHTEITILLSVKWNKPK